MDDHVTYVHQKISKKSKKNKIKIRAFDLDFLALALVVPSCTLNPKA